jgi:hypothetical protein
MTLMLGESTLVAQLVVEILPIILLESSHPCDESLHTF